MSVLAPEDRQPENRRSAVHAAPSQPPSELSMWFSDGWTVTKRNLTKLKRSPDMLIFAVLQPIMFVLLFSQIYGGSIQVEGADYTQYLMAGIFAQTVIFGSTFSGSAMAQDLKDGIIDRFRTLPMSSSAVLIGRTNSDLVLNALSVVIMMATGFVVGWRVNASMGSFLAGLGLLLLFSYAFSWVMALLGMSVKSPEVINNASFMILFPLTFISNAFVQSQNLPSALETFANWNPVSALVQAARELFGNTVPGAPVPEAWPLQHPALYTLLWTAIILAVFVPLSVRTYRRTAAR